jgi:hypothetical protein
MLAVLLVSLTLMLAASGIHRLIGNAGASVISRVMGLVLASVATNQTLAGIKAYFALEASSAQVPEVVPMAFYRRWACSWTRCKARFLTPVWYRGGLTRDGAPATRNRL